MKLLYTLLLASASAVSAIDDGDTNIRGGEVQRRLPGNGNGNNNSNPGNSGNSLFNPTSSGPPGLNKHYATLTPPKGFTVELFYQFEDVSGSDEECPNNICNINAWDVDVDGVAKKTYRFKLNEVADGDSTKLEARFTVTTPGITSGSIFSARFFLSCPPGYAVNNFHAESGGVNKCDGKRFGKDNGMCNTELKVFRKDNGPTAGDVGFNCGGPALNTSCSRDVRLVCRLK